MIVQIHVEELPYNAAEAKAFAEHRGIEIIELNDGTVETVSGAPLVVNSYTITTRIGEGAQEPSGQEIDAAVRKLLLDRASKDAGMSDLISRPAVPRPADVSVFKADYSAHHEFRVS